MKRITIDDVAKRAGVSKGTVSAVINAKNSVKPSTSYAAELSSSVALLSRSAGLARTISRISSAN